MLSEGIVVLEYPAECLFWGILAFREKFSTIFMSFCRLRFRQEGPTRIFVYYNIIISFRVYVSPLCSDIANFASSSPDRSRQAPDRSRQAPDRSRQVPIGADKSR
jgi:hypothetical protein